jgi:hypothetical protein
MRLTVCHPRQLGRLSEFRGAWVYADTDYAEYERVRNRLRGSAHPLCAPRQFQEAAIGYRAVFVDWIDGNLAGASGARLLLTPLSRNPFHDLFLHSVWILLIAEKLADCSEDILVVTSSSGLARAIRQCCEERGTAVRLAGGASYLLSAARKNLRSIVKFGYQLFHSLCSLTLSRLWLGAAYRRRLSDVDLLVDTFLFRGDVSPEGTVNHRYFPGLLDWYAKQGNRPAYYPTLFRVPLRCLAGLYRGYERSAYLFCPPELFLHLSDLGFAAADCLLQSARATDLPRPALLGADITPLVEGLRFQAGMDGLQPMLLARAPQRLAESGVRPRWLLDWFENQPLDQATMTGFGQALPNCQAVALRQYASYSAILSFCVTTREVAQGVVPSIHWVCGEAWKERIAIHDRLGSYRVVPALRYGYLHHRAMDGRDGSELLVLLTHSADESASVLALIDEAFPVLDPLFSGIVIKTHPALGLRRLRRAMAQSGGRVFRAKSVRFESARLDELFSSARVVVSAGSGAALEAVSAGLPVLLVGRCAGINVCPLEYVDQRLWQTVFDAAELEVAIRNWSPRHPLARIERQEMGRKVMNEFFEPVTDEGMQRFAVV